MSAAVKTASCITVLLVGAGCGGQVSSPDASASAGAGTSRLIDYTKGADGRIVLESASDLSKLVGAPADFKSFVAGKLDEAAKRSDAKDPCTKPSIGVEAIDTSGYASGDDFVAECGGASFVWARRKGVWREVWGGQFLPDCTTMHTYAVPQGLYTIVSRGIGGNEATDRCYEPGAKGPLQSVPYSP